MKPMVRRMHSNERQMHIVMGQFEIFCGTDIGETASFLTALAQLRISEEIVWTCSVKHKLSNVTTCTKAAAWHHISTFSISLSEFFAV